MPLDEKSVAPALYARFTDSMSSRLVCINIGTLLFGTYWLETTLARSHRLRGEVGGANPELAAVPAARLFRANVASMTYFWGFIALSSTLFLLMFYVL